MVYYLHKAIQSCQILLRKRYSNLIYRSEEKLMTASQMLVTARFIPLKAVLYYCKCIKVLCKVVVVSYKKKSWAKLKDVLEYLPFILNSSRVWNSNCFSPHFPTQRLALFFLLSYLDWVHADFEELSQVQKAGSR